jgi:riboflavin biosynthesis pyrimidine reductase
LHSRWRPQIPDSGGIYERLHAQLDGDAWLVGRVTGQEFAKAKAAYPAKADQTYPREAWFARRDAEVYGVVLDEQGKIAWGRSDIGGDPIVVVLTEQVPDAPLAGLRRDGVSYFFAGEQKLDLERVLETLNRELGVKRLLLEGGGTINGEFLRAGLVDEISVAICPAVDGARGAPSLFDSRERDAEVRAPLAAVTLEKSEVLDGGTVWLRYRVENAAS